MDQFFYFLSGRHRSDLKHLIYLKKSLSKASTEFPRLTTSMEHSNCKGFYLYGYLGLNYQAIKTSLQSQKLLFIFDNPAIKLKNLPVLRVHQKTLEYLEIPRKSNLYYDIKYNTARKFFETIKDDQVKESAIKPVNNFGLVIDKSYPFSSLVDFISPGSFNDFYQFQNNLLSSSNMKFLISRKDPYISSVSRFGIPNFSPSQSPQPDLQSQQPSYVFAFQSTAILKYLFDLRVNCYVSRFNPFYIDEFTSVRHDTDFIHFLSHRFASTHFFFDEIIEYSQCLSH